MSPTMQNRRMYARLWARRKRARTLEDARMGHVRCPRKPGRFGECRGVLQNVVRHDGWMETICPLCERREQGVCRDCPLPVDGQPRKAIRCAGCKRQVAREATCRYVERNRRLVNRKAREYGRLKRRERAEYKRLWRKAYPDKVRAQKRRAALRRSKRVLDYHKQYRATHAWKAPGGSRRCTGDCGVQVTGRAKKCEPCRVRAQRDALGQLGKAA
jgi:hypothetical protein